MKKKLNIAYFLDNFFPQVNGVVTSSINTAIECARRGHNIFTVVPDSKIMNQCPDDYFPYRVHHTPGFPAFFYPDFIFTNPFSHKTYKLTKEFKPDLIHFHGPFTLGYQAIRVAHKLNIPVIGTFHTFFAEPEYLGVIGLEKWTFLIGLGWWFSNQFFNRCDAVVSPGNATANILKEKKLDNKLHVISNGVEVQKYKDFKFDSKLFPLEPKKDEEWLLYIGRVSNEKCMDVLLEGFKLVNKKRKQTRLLIVGGGPTLNKSVKYAKKIGIEDITHFSGEVPNKNLLESGILKKMKLFTTASTSENQPMTILESIMFGLPVVLADAKGNPELCEGNGFIFEPGKPQDMCDKIIKILEDKKLHTKFSKKSIELRERHDIRFTTDQMEQLYFRVVEERQNKFKN